MRQAVIVIHGIGEHKPMDTLRRFVDGVLGEPPNPERPKFHSKPDGMSESFELRKLLAPQTRRRPITDPLRELEIAGRSLPAEPSEADVCLFQEKHRALWLEQRRHGNPWLVTDLITIGSPLVHAKLLLTNGKEELARRQAEYELPTCPP